MASFTIKIKGTKKNISKFFSALTHEGDVRIGRGAEADICYLSKREALITGICKDNIHNDLIAEAKYRSSLDAPKESITLFDACKKYRVSMVLHSEDAPFFEHYSCSRGKIKESRSGFLDPDGTF